MKKARNLAIASLLVVFLTGCTNVNNSVQNSPVQNNVIQNNINIKDEKRTTTFMDNATGLMWQDNNDVKTIKKDWEGAKVYCENLTLGEFSDWRLPNIYELTTIIADTKSSYPLVIDGIKNIENHIYWSSTTIASNSSKAWFVSFFNGNDDWDVKTYSYYVRCVRAGELNFDNLVILKNQGKLKTRQTNIDNISPEGEAKRIKELEINKQKELAKQKELELKQKDKSAYDVASSTNTINSYKEYLKKFPNGNYTSSARSEIQYLETEAAFQSLLQSKSPQIMYIEAGKLERDGSTSKANKLYNAIIDRFPTSDFAVKSSDKLTGASRMEAAESNRRSQNRQQCENIKKSCIAGCGGYISGADNHNSNMWQCKNKCEEMSCY